MCGITGIYAFNEAGRFNSVKLSQANDSLKKRGPDFANMSLHHHVNLGHTRLSIIDPNPEANQPMQDESGRYTLVFNGEIYNYKEIRERLESRGARFHTQSDTEVLLQGYIMEEERILQRLNGFFAFALYDEETKELFLARDRMGIKPLLIYEDEDKLIFGSEMKALMNFGIPKEIDWESLYTYMQLNYIPGPATIFKHVRKLLPGRYLRVKPRRVEEDSFYHAPFPNMNAPLPQRSYLDFQKELREVLEKSVQARLVADVPLGAFLSGGIDSSIITALASRHTKQLNTFSIGYQDEPFFDETKYARLVAKKFQTNHTVFSLSNRDLYEHLHNVLDYLDEPFADSSALAVYILSQRTAKQVKVALSGDGSDELFSGYNKHQAELRVRQGGILAQTIKNLKPLWERLPKSRQGALTNKVRQFQRFAEGMELSARDRYWRWAGFVSEDEALRMFSKKIRYEIDQEIYLKRRTRSLRALRDYFSREENVKAFNQVLFTDVEMVLGSDMLTKVDLMSMANSLEIRVPFLDHRVVDLVMPLPVEFKINRRMRKRILQDAFRELLPRELYRRPKRGFEVPLLKWFRGELRSWIEQDLLDDDFIEAQGIFEVEAIRALKQKLFSSDPGDVHARIWGLVVFQNWWKKWMA